MIDLVVSLAAMWGAGLSTILAIIQFLSNRHKMKFEVDKSYYLLDMEFSDIRGIAVHLNVKNKGKKTCIHKIILTVKGLEGKFETTTGKSEFIPEEGIVYFPTRKIEDNFDKGDSKQYELKFFDEGLSKFLTTKESDKKKHKCQLEIHDTYKINKVDFIIEPNHYPLLGED